jgi:tRNA modification GTPase
MKTIAAIATALAPGGVGIVRVSGPSALTVLGRLCPSLPADLKTHRLYHTRVLRDGEVLDDVLVVTMRGPRSFTGDDVVEIHGHGGVVNMQRLLDAVLAHGVEMAGPGEFTRRAYLNGRMDLTQAEAVIDVINARSEAALELAQAQMAGRLGDEVRGLREELAVAVTLTEAAIDFSTEEHVYQLDAGDLVARIDGVSVAIARLLGTYDAGRRVREGVRAVFVGRPNAGKSSVFNALCGADRSIVTAVPGTTRDYVEAAVDLAGVPLQLVDTAGIRDSDDEVERIGVERSIEQARIADILVWIIDRSQRLSLSPEERSILRRIPVVAVLNKADLPNGLHPEDRDAVASVARAIVDRSPSDAAEVAEALVTVGRGLMRPAGEGAIIARARHRQALQRCQECLSRARQAGLDGLSHEFLALDLRLALDALGEVVGHVSVDDVLHRIFAEFCVGK